MRQFFTLLALVISFSSFSQTNKGKISGSINDGNQKPIESASVSLLSAKDSSLIKINVVNKEGKFLFEDVVTGKYLVGVTAVGHVPAFSEPFEVKDGVTVSVKTIQLTEASKTLAAVTVVSKKPLIEQKIDRTVVNVEASVTNVGSSALEVLEKSPGVTVDKDGNISLKGKEGVFVLVDGRPTQLSGTDLANLLRSMSANQLDQIEIMTNPPAKYDAAGNAGIINIKTKKTKQFGYSGSATIGYGQGRYPKFNEGLTFNYRKNKFNFFTNFSHYYFKDFEKLDIQRNFVNKSTNESSFFDQQARMGKERNSFSGKIGVDYFASAKTTIGVVFSGMDNSGDFQNRNNTLIYDNSMNLENVTNALVKSNSSFKNFSTNVNFRRLLDTTGKEITADVDYIAYRSRDNQTLSNYYFDNAGNKTDKADTLYGALPQDIQIVSGRVDYLQPLKKGARFETGIKSSIVETNNNAIYDTVAYGTVNRDKGKSNDFDYKENINAAYVNLSTPLSKKLSAQLGLRLENTVSSGHSTGFVYNNTIDEWVSFDSTFNNNYTQLFPTAYFQYKADEKNNFGINYGRRIRRPNYGNLNPFIEYLDRYTYQKGNPKLKPQFSHNIELTHTYRNFLTTTFNYTNTTDIIQQLLEQNTEKKETYMVRANIAKQRQYGVSVNSSVPLTKWWSSNIYVNVSNNHFEGIVNNEPVTVDATMFMVNGSQQFTISKNTSAEISGFYRSEGVDGVLRIKPMGAVSVGFSQQIMKGKGSLRLNIRDVFYSQKFQGESKYADVDASFQNARDSRVINLGFTYRFSKGKAGSQRKRSGSASEEQSRVGGS